MPTKKELYEKATILDIEGRSSMSKEELAEAIAKATASTAPKTRKAPPGGGYS